MHILNGQAVPGRNQGHQSLSFYFAVDFLVVLFCVSIAVICKCFTEIMLSLVTGSLEQLEQPGSTCCVHFQTRQAGSAAVLPRVTFEPMA